MAVQNRVKGFHLRPRYDNWYDISKWVLSKPLNEHSGEQLHFLVGEWSGEFSATIFAFWGEIEHLFDKGAHEKRFPEKGVCKIT